MSDKVLVQMSAPEHTELGKVLFRLYYTSGRALLELAPGRSGYPHNGGEHTLLLEGERKDVLAWLELLTEEYPVIRKPVAWLFQDICSEKACKRFTIGRYALM